MYPIRGCNQEGFPQEVPSGGPAGPRGDPQRISRWEHTGLGPRLISRARRWIS